MKVKFINIGRKSANFEAECEEFTYEWLVSKVKRHLMSRNIDIEWDDDKLESGNIYAGCHCVGRFEVL